MQYTLAELRSVFNVYIAETGISRRALCEKVTPGNLNTMRRLFEGAIVPETIEKLSDWVDENWPAGMEWPRDVEQRQPGLRARNLRQQQELNIQARKLRRFDDRLRELSRVLGEVEADDRMMVQEARRVSDTLVAMGLLLDDMRHTLGPLDDGNGAGVSNPDTDLLQAASGG